MTSVDRSRALTFGQVADEYDRWRPGYPDDAVAWLAPPAPACVADVGAGTGKLSASLVEHSDLKIALNWRAKILDGSLAAKRLPFYLIRGKTRSHPCSSARRP